MFYFRGEVSLGLPGDVGSRLDQRRHVRRGPVVPVGLGQDAWQPFGGLAGLVTLEAQGGTLLAPGDGVGLRRGDLRRQRGRGGPGRGGGVVLLRRLLRQGPQGLQPAGLRDVLLGDRAKFGGGGVRPGGSGDAGDRGTGLLLGAERIGQRAGSPLAPPRARG